MTMNPLPCTRLSAPCAANWHFSFLLIIFFATVGNTSSAVAQSVDEIRCGALQIAGQYGPYDYRYATREQKFLVEGAHFTSDVELLRSGTSQRLPGPDIAYTLRSFPNHPRALKSVMDLGIRDKTILPFGLRWPVDCWFSRAIRFTPDDPQVRMLYGIFLLRRGDRAAAIAELETARSIGASGANFQYNLGLAYFQVQDYEKARQQAYKAKDLGYELDGLKNMLTRAGQWRERDPASIPPLATEPATPEPVAPKN